MPTFVGEMSIPEANAEKTLTTISKNKPTVKILTRLYMLATNTRLHGCYIVAVVVAVGCSDGDFRHDTRAQMDNCRGLLSHKEELVQRVALCD